MEIVFENKMLDSYREYVNQVKRVQESAESVVPDTNEDIGRIASVQTGLLLKSKDVTSRGVLVSGEAQASLLYITEDESAVSFVKLSKSFSMEFDVQDLKDDSLAQINLNIINTETRIINPRKVSVTMEIQGELSCYCEEKTEIKTELPEVSDLNFHAKIENTDAVIASAVCEKTFTLNDQFVFPSGKPVPQKLVLQKVDFAVTETQYIGSKVIVKGNAIIHTCYQSSEVNYPLRTEFTAPFSQIVDAGCDGMDSCTAFIELTSAYFDLIDTISGEKALDVELHALIQLVARERCKISYISDAYSNVMPLECGVQNCRIDSVSDMYRAKLNADERISVVEDCSDVLSIFAEAGLPVLSNGKLNAAVSLDIIYKTRSGSLSAARRVVNLEGEYITLPTRILKYRLSDVYLRPDGAFIDAHISMELSYHSGTSNDVMRVCSVELDEDNAYDISSFASLSLVRVEEESLWELAKSYHSSPDIIEKMNDTEAVVSGSLILIPKEV